MENNSQKKISGFKKFLIVIGVCVVIWSGYIVVYYVNSNPDYPTTTAKSCEIVHEIFAQDGKKELSGARQYLMDWRAYRDDTLYNFGLVGRSNVQWNKAWIIDEAFIREYVERYSANEFMQMYSAYVLAFVEDGRSFSFYDTASKFYKANPQLMANISETTELLFQMTDVFNVVEYNPVGDQYISMSSIDEEVKGKFNAGKDNHVEYRTATQTTDTFIYDGYTVKYTHGSRYNSGKYGWYGGKFVDISAHWEAVNEYRLYVENQVIGPASSLKELTGKCIAVGNTLYFERKLSGWGYNSSSSGKFNSQNFLQPIYMLTNKGLNAAEHYLIFR